MRLPCRAVWTVIEGEVECWRRADLIQGQTGTCLVLRGDGCMSFASPPWRVGMGGTEWIYVFCEGSFHLVRLSVCMLSL